MKNGKRLAAAAAVSMALLGSALAQTYPNQSITVIVPYAPGGNTDVVGRLVTEQMSNILGEKMIIENVAGAGGTTGSQRASRAKPDGYTLLVGQMGTHAASVGLYPNLAYNPVTDFEHIGQLSDTPIGILVRKNFPAKDLRSFIELVKAQPQKYNNGHGGVGSTSHVSCLFLSSLIGARAPMVAYRGSGPAFNDLLSEQYDFLCDQIPHTVEHVKAGTVRMLAVGIPSARTRCRTCRRRSRLDCRNSRRPAGTRCSRPRARRRRSWRRSTPPCARRSIIPPPRASSRRSAPFRRARKTARRRACASS